MNQYHEVDSDSSEDGLLLKLRGKRKCFILAISLTPLMSLEYEDRHSRSRVGNQHRDRHSIRFSGRYSLENMQRACEGTGQYSVHNRRRRMLSNLKAWAVKQKKDGMSC
jgi:hypothetical protein